MLTMNDALSPTVDATRIWPRHCWRTSIPISDSTAKVLDRLQSYLASALGDGSIALTDDNEDGRVNSQTNERQLSQALRLFTHSNDWFRNEGYQLEVAEPRFWYDFSVRGHVEFVPVNVKVSTLRSNDNLSSKEGLFYALTGVDPKSVSINSWERFCCTLAQRIDRETTADYYFLVVRKTDPGDVFWTSLKSLAVLSPNGSNPPYQCKWSSNRIRVDRTSEDAASFLLGVMRESFIRGANPLLSFDRHLRGFI